MFNIVNRSLLLLILAVGTLQGLYGQTQAVPTAVNTYTTEQLKTMGTELATKAATTGSATENLVNEHPDHFTMLAYRNRTGNAEVHMQFADVFSIVQGSATLETGGTVVAPKTSSPGEIRGTDIEHGVDKPLHAGDIVEIPAGVPHLMKLAAGETILYFVVKIQEGAAH
jgi:mannose-6-phosphate isomerase-like protein (cupin superfamily)